MSNIYNLAAVGLFALIGVLVLVQAEHQQKQTDLRNQENVVMK